MAKLEMGPTFNRLSLMVKWYVTFDPAAAAPLLSSPYRSNSSRSWSLFWEGVRGKIK